MTNPQDQSQPAQPTPGWGGAPSPAEFPPAPGYQPAPGWGAPPPPKKKGHGCLIAFIIVLVIFLVGAGSCAILAAALVVNAAPSGSPSTPNGTQPTQGQATQGSTAPTPTVASTSAASPSSPILRASTAPTPTVAPTGPVTYKIGQTATSDRDGQKVNITVSDVTVAKTYTSNGYVDKPQVAGNVFISAKITYEALTDGVTYSTADWDVFNDGVAVTGYTIVLGGPKPLLSSGSLTTGRKAIGYVIYEVPPKGEVRLSYKAVIFDTTPTFEFVIRAA
jgi:hypothetical protein